MAERSKLPRANSLKSRRDIDQLFKQGQRLTGENLVSLWQKSARFEYGVFVSRTLGSAVRRNRMKRRLREAIRLNRTKLRAPVRVGLVPRKGCAQSSFEQIYADVERTFEHINAATN